MKQVSRAALTGYRQPASLEAEPIVRYIRRELSRQRRIQGVWQIFCTIAAVSMLLCPFIPSDEIPMPEKLVGFVIGIPMFFAAKAIRKSRKRKKLWIQEVCSGRFQVMDCWIYETQFGGDLNGMAWVKVYNSQGQYCAERMLVDYWAAEYYQRGERNKLLLMRCGDDYFELFSDTKLGIRRV